MSEIDNFLEFIYENREHDKIDISRRIKYGSKHYFIHLSLEVEKTNSEFTYSNGGYFSQFSVAIDTANNFIDVQSDEGSASFEDPEVVVKWSNILDEYLNKNSVNKLEGIIIKSLSNSRNKDLLRAFNLKKIL